LSVVLLVASSLAFRPACRPLNTHMPLLQATSSGNSDKHFSALDDADGEYAAAGALNVDAFDSGEEQALEKVRKKDMGYGFVYEDDEDEDDANFDVHSNSYKRRQEEHNDNEWMFFDVAKVGYMITCTYTCTCSHSHITVTCYLLLVTWCMYMHMHTHTHVHTPTPTHTHSTSCRLTSLYTSPPQTFDVTKT